MRLYSRKNTVTLENGKVIKKFADIISLRREFDMVKLLKSRGVPVPDVLRVYGSTIEYGFIKGETYQSLVDCFEKKHARALLEWLELYYAAAGTLRGDVNLRNFIYSGEDVCYGVDFEEICHAGERESDFGRIIAFAVTYEPPFTKEKANCAKLLLGCFNDSGADEIKIREAYIKEMQDIVKRRRESSYDTDKARNFWSLHIAGR